MAASSVLHDNATCCAGAASRSQRLRLDLLGGSWVVISRVISRATILVTYISSLITSLITTSNLQVGCKNSMGVILNYSLDHAEAVDLRSSYPKP